MGRRSWSWFCAWALVGGLAAFGMVSLGIFALFPAAAVAVLLARHEPAREGAWGALAGIGGLALTVAWLQRQGPGTTCWQRGSAFGCDEHLDPRPWLAVGIALVAAGVAAQARRARRS